MNKFAGAAEMDRWVLRWLRVAVVAVTVAAVPVFSQAPPQPNPRQGPGGQQGQGGGNRHPGGTNPPRPSPRPTGGRPGGNQPGNQRPSRPNPQPNPGRPNGGRPNAGRPNDGRPNAGGPQRPNPGNRPGNRPPQWGRPPQNRPAYSFRPNDRAYLRNYYRHRFGYINRARRPVFRIGGFFPFGDISYLSPLPQDLYGYLPPPPPGYQMGYFDGYVVVYDPVTYFLANVIDLIR